MGRRGRNAVSEIFMGSVSRKIVHHCPDHFVALVTAG
jgi:nucleotide-binding universal stress UspA family protein